MGFFIVWVILSFIVASQGKYRRIGWTASFLISLLLSPLIGFLAVIASVPISHQANDSLKNDDDNSFNIDDYRSN